MAIVFDQDIHVHYGQFYVESRSDDFFEDLTESRSGQTNGLCGAAVPGLLFLTTGLHTGHTRVTAEVLDAPVPVGDEWEDVVEVSFRPATRTVALVQWAGEASWPLPLPPFDYRVRYCATGMDSAHQKDTLLSGQPLLDRYLLQFWPAPASPDAVIRETSQIAAYWNTHARTLPPRPTQQQRVESKLQKQAARDRLSREAALASETRRWGGGQLPDERVRQTNGALELVRIDREVVDRITDLDPATQRAVAIWAARRACVAAGLTDLDWVKQILAALERHEALPFDLAEAFRLLRADAHAPRTAVESYDGRRLRVSQQHMAVPALWSAAAEDPLAASLESLFHTIVTLGVDYPRLLSEVRVAFPQLADR